MQCLDPTEIMAKRRADKDLNHDNWDRDDDNSGDEPLGVFKRASDDELSKRKIKVLRGLFRCLEGSDDGVNALVMVLRRLYWCYRACGSVNAIVVVLAPLW